MSFLLGGISAVVGLYFLWVDVVRPAASIVKREVKAYINDEGPYAPNPYKQDHIDSFYWDNNWEGYAKIPLIKPYYLISNVKYRHQKGDPDEWSLDDSSSLNTPHGITALGVFGVADSYIYGLNNGRIYRSTTDWTKTVYDPFYFLIDTKNNLIHKYETRSLWRQALDSLELPKDFHDPDHIYWPFRVNPVLPWFPEEIKQQLKAAKAKRE
ncbi:MAG: hypothetical protein OIF50_12100 [Flavobacteriaceae bacterium]|nr:hypothetical protein [Flavobacteriaceae bacterium]